jgi:hypothetical protein
MHNVKYVQAAKEMNSNETLRKGME